VVATLGTDHRVISIIEIKITRQLIGAQIANVSAVIGALFGIEELDWHLITLRFVAQTTVCAMMVELPPTNALRVA